MENEKRLEHGMENDNSNTDQEQNLITTKSTATALFPDNNDDDDDDINHIPIGGRWEELHGNFILRPQYSSPPNSSSLLPPPPRALIHFLGGALLGAAPQLTYRYLLERLSSHGFLVVATPYQLSFDHLSTCDEIIERFELVAPDLAKRECVRVC